MLFRSENPWNDAGEDHLACTLARDECVDDDGDARRDEDGERACGGHHSSGVGLCVAVARHLGHERFILAGHDRGSYAALRLALDHPEVVDKLILMDCLPISEHLRRADARFATAWWHWFFFAQPDVPERVINADPAAWYLPKADPMTMGQANHEELMSAVRRPDVVRAMLEDYRAGLTIDRMHEEADREGGRRLQMPTLVLWSLQDDLEALYGDPLAIWTLWADDVRGAGIDSRHHLAEEAPGDVVRAFTHFLAR